MRDVLEEVHRATLMDERASALYEPLVPPGNKLCVFVWDGYPTELEKPKEQSDQRSTHSTKTKGNCMNRIEAVDLEGRPVFKLCLSASISPRWVFLMIH